MLRDTQHNAWQRCSPCAGPFTHLSTGAQLACTALQQVHPMAFLPSDIVGILEPKAWWMGGSTRPPDSGFSGQNTTSKAKSENKSRAGEKTLVPPCFCTGLAGSFFSQNSVELKGKERGEGFTVAYSRRRKSTETSQRR